MKKYRVISIDYSQVPPKTKKICSTFWFNKAFYTAIAYATKNSLSEDSFQKKLLNAEMAWSDRESIIDESKSTELHVVMIQKKKKKTKVKEEVNEAKEKEKDEM